MIDQQLEPLKAAMAAHERKGADEYQWSLDARAHGLPARIAASAGPALAETEEDESPFRRQFPWDVDAIRRRLCPCGRDDCADAIGRELREMSK